MVRTQRHGLVLELTPYGAEVCCSRTTARFGHDFVDVFHHGPFVKGFAPYHGVQPYRKPRTPGPGRSAGRIAASGPLAVVEAERGEDAGLQRRHGSDGRVDWTGDTGVPVAPPVMTLASGGPGRPLTTGRRGPDERDRTGVRRA